MTSFRVQNNRLLLIILAYGFVAIGWNLRYGSAFHDEALTILMGHQILEGQSCPGCAQNTGFIYIQPVLAAIGDSLGGLYGARAVGIFFGLGLAWIMYMIGRTLFSEKAGLLSALVFLLTGTSLYLSKLATYDIIAAFFLGLSFLLIVLSEKRQSPLWLLAGAVALFLASITKYVVPVYIGPFLIYVFWRQKFSRALLSFFLPLFILLALYGYLVLYPMREALAGNFSFIYHNSRVPFSLLSSSTLRWLLMPYLLATFGAFHREHGGKALILIALSTPIVFFHLLSGAEQGVNKNVLLAIVLVTPASALGVDQMGSLFSSNIRSARVKAFFISLVLVVIWVFGINELRWLERQYPDLSEVIGFFKEKGFDGMTVVIDSRYGDPDCIYRYHLEKTYPRARFFSMSRLDLQEQSDLLDKVEPDFLMLDEYYGVSIFREPAMVRVQKNYSIVKDCKMHLSWGVKDIKIFRRRLNI